jgi:hypothetical protein
MGTHKKEIRERIHEFGEAESQAMQSFIFLHGITAVPLSKLYR